MRRQNILPPPERHGTAALAEARESQVAKATLQSWPEHGSARRRRALAAGATGRWDGRGSISNRRVYINRRVYTCAMRASMIVFHVRLIIMVESRRGNPRPTSTSFSKVASLPSC